MDVHVDVDVGRDRDGGHGAWLRLPAPLPGPDGAFGRLLIAWAAPLVVLVAAHAPLLHPGASALASGKLRAPDPRTCKVGTCWDGATKFGFPQCTGGSGQVVRGEVIRVGESTCYKAIYVNLDARAAGALSVLVAWVVFFGFLASRVFDLAAARRPMRWLVLTALAASVFPLYYSFMTPFIYINEALDVFLPAQLFFSVTEVAAVASIASALARDDPVHRRAIILAGGFALLHLTQLALDEGFGPLAANARRNAFMALGDAAVLGASAHLLPSSRDWGARAAVTFAGLVAFQLLVAGPVSFNVRAWLERES